MNLDVLYRVKVRQGLVGAAVCLLVLTVAAEYLIPLHGHFESLELPGFHALYGFASCVILIFLARVLGRLVKRPEQYYGE